jgi:hypothetical protein
MSQPVDKRELIAWLRADWRRITNPKVPKTCSEVSDENGVFRIAQASLTYQDEDPAVHTITNDAVPLSLVKIATAEQKRKYLALEAAINNLKAQLFAVQNDIIANGIPMTWEWIMQHGKPRENNYVPVPHHSRTSLANLRKGSRVVIAVQSSAYYQIAGRVGKIVKKRSKDVIVQFGQHQYRIPYPDLKPAAQVSAKERADAKQGSESLGRMASQLGKMLS